MVRITHPTGNQTRLHTETTCMQDEACAGFKHVRVNDSLFHIMYCIYSVVIKLKATRTEAHEGSWSAVETSSVIQATVRINFRAESSFLRTPSCVNVMTLTPFPQRDLKQRDTNHSSFDLPGVNLPPDIFTFSALFSHIYHPWYLHFVVCPSFVTSSLMFLGPVRRCGLYIPLSRHWPRRYLWGCGSNRTLGWTKNKAKLQEMCSLCCWFIVGVQ